jgi:hypothetical protein
MAVAFETTVLATTVSRWRISSGGVGPASKWTAGAVPEINNDSCSTRSTSGDSDQTAESLSPRTRQSVRKTF